MADEESPERNPGFDDSRRLTGPNRWFAGTAVVLTPLGKAARDPAAHFKWAANVRRGCVILGWPDGAPRVDARDSEVTLAFAAPEDLLFTATELNEWAWERAAAACGEESFDLAQDLGDDAMPVLAARATAEFRPALAALRGAAQARGLPWLLDDEAASIGAGSGSSATWPRADVPAPETVPWAPLHDVPTALVTGSNGKTTTVRLLAAMAAAAGRAPGYCCTEGVFVAGSAVHSGDYSGPAGARTVLRHAGVDLAVLETARGGLLRRGLAVSRADVAVVTNISPDHLGEYGVENADDLAEVKLIVARAVQGDGGTLVLNADDAVLMAAAAHLPHAAAARHALFAFDHDHPALRALRERGGDTCGVRNGQLLLSRRGSTQVLCRIDGMPLGLGGAAQHNVENAAAAVLAAVALKLPLDAITRTLAVFGSRPQDNPGRLERWPHHGATVLIDYAHNPDGLAQLLRVARALKPTRLGLLLGQAGNRSDDAIRELARTAAGFAPERIVIKELPLMLRGRAPGSVPALIDTALRSAGIADEQLQHEPDETTAALALLAWAQPGDVIVLPVHTATVRAALAQCLTAG